MIPPTVIPNEHTNVYQAAFQQQMAKYQTLTKLHEEISRKRNLLLIDELKQDLFRENVDIF